MSTVFNVIAAIVMIAVVVVLIRGLINLMRGGSGNRTRIVLTWCRMCF